MALLRKHQRVTFTVVDNAAVRDPDLSWKATGLLTFLLGQPDDWKVSVKHLTTCKVDGRDSVQSGLDELEAAGYLRRSVVRNAKGHLQTVIDIAESRELLTALDHQPSMDFPASVNPHETTPKNGGQPIPGLPISENPSDGKSAPTKEHKKKEPKRSNARASQINEEEEKTLRASVFDVSEADIEAAARAKTNAKGGGEGLYDTILRNDRAELIEKIIEARTLEHCPDCDPLGRAWYDRDGVPVGPDDPTGHRAVKCTHPEILETAG
jgi:hypothetical protein